MEFENTSKTYYLNKLTYTNLRWIAIIGQFITINSVKFIFNFEFNFILANLIVFLGANNYNENGIFVTRDFGLRRLYSIKDIPEILHLENGFSNSLEIIFSNLIPIYGRRMEIRDFGILKRMLFSKYDTLLPQGMRPLKHNWDKKNKSIDTVEDTQYLLTYKRSVYNNFKLSKLHTDKLEQLIADNDGSSIILVQLPIKEQMYELQKNMIKNVFDDYIATLSRSNDNVFNLDLRENTNYEFSDINHLSMKGSFDLTQEILNPLIEKIIINN